MLRETCRASLSFLIWTSRRDARRDILALVIDNHLSPNASLFQPRNPPLPPLPVPIVPSAQKNAQLQIPTVNRRDGRFSLDSLSLSHLSLSLAPSFPSDPGNLLFPLSPLAGLSRRTLALPSLSLFLSLFLTGPRFAYPRPWLFLSFSFSFCLSRSMHPAFLIVRGYLIPREWKRKREERIYLACTCT